MTLFLPQLEKENDRRCCYGVSLAAQMVKNLPATQETQVQSRGQERSPGGGGSGNPLQYSCLENPMDRGAWEVTVHGSQRVGHS